MSLACIIDVSGTVLTPDEIAFFKDAAPWGIILFGRSCQNKDQIKKLTDDIRNAIPHDCLIFIDQEGGRVQRLKPPIWPQWPPNKIYGEIYEKSPQKAARAIWLHHRLIAHDLIEVGVDADCAPCVDLSIKGAHSVIGDRAISYDEAIISKLGNHAILGLHDGGVASVIKHIPGHGRAMADSHHELPIVTHVVEELAKDFAPFKALKDAPMAMTAHVKYDAIDKENCATLSPTIINELIRKEFGFDGLLMTDDISMKALGGTNKDKINGAINAGCDVVMLCNAPLNERIDFANNCPNLSKIGQIRADAALKVARQEIQKIDYNSTWQEFSEILNECGALNLALLPDPTERL